MGIRNYFKRSNDTYATNDLFLQAMLGSAVISRESAMEIPSVNGCVNLIANMVACLPVECYERADGKVHCKDDYRLQLLNNDTNDILNGFELKRNMVIDYLLYGSNYNYIAKTRNKVTGLHYIDNNYISVMASVDPIRKDGKIQISGDEYRHFDFVKILRNTKDGLSGTGLVQENKELLALAYNLLRFKKNNIQAGGIKKGVIKSDKRLTEDALRVLKQSWNQLYGKDTSENCIILNDGLDYKELSSTALELQLDEMTNTVNRDICTLLNVPPSVLDGTATEKTYDNFIKTVIVPILMAIESALNQSLLLESEKGAFYFAFNSDELLKGDLLKRYQAYKEALQSGWITINEVREREGYEDIEGLDVVTMSLGNVVFDKNNGQYFTPNMGSKTDLKKVGDEVNESTDQR